VAVEGRRLWRFKRTAGRRRRRLGRVVALDAAAAAITASATGGKPTLAAAAVATVPCGVRTAAPSREHT